MANTESTAGAFAGCSSTYSRHLAEQDIASKFAAGARARLWFGEALACTGSRRLHVQRGKKQRVIANVAGVCGQIVAFSSIQSRLADGGYYRLKTARRTNRQPRG
jgi:hypothetical protein